MLSYRQRSSRCCHSNSFSLLIDSIIIGSQGGGGEEDLKICMVIMMSAEALQSDEV